jgi:hyperosmotically inducible periplasmic protein
MDRRVLVITMSFLAYGMLPRAFAQSPPAIPTATAPDNTGINTRDRADNAMTASSQSGSKGDLTLTARIRRAIVKDKSLSTMARNVKIISRNGEVTLRGPVKSEQERTTVGSKAQAIAGTDRVDNRLEVAGQ